MGTRLVLEDGTELIVPEGVNITIKDGEVYFDGVLQHKQNFEV